MTGKKETEKKGGMTVAEAGRRGGLQTSERHGHEYYVNIGAKGGGKVGELIRKGKEALAKEAAEKAKEDECCEECRTVAEAGKKGGEKTKKLIEKGKEASE